MIKRRIESDGNANGNAKDATAKTDRNARKKENRPKPKVLGRAGATGTDAPAGGEGNRIDTLLARTHRHAEAASTLASLKAVFLHGACKKEKTSLEEAYARGFEMSLESIQTKYDKLQRRLTALKTADAFGKRIAYLEKKKNNKLQEEMKQLKILNQDLRSVKAAIREDLRKLLVDEKIEGNVWQQVLAILGRPQVVARVEIVKGA